MVVAVLNGRDFEVFEGGKASLDNIAAQCDFVLVCKSHDRQEILRGLGDFEQCVEGVETELLTESENVLIPMPRIRWYPDFACPRCGGESQYRNVERNHWCYCQLCGVKWQIGENLFSSLQDETPAIWKDNAQLLAGFVDYAIAG